MLGLVLACAQLGASGCAGLKRSEDSDPRPKQPDPLPTETLAAYRQALERDDPQAAYRLLSPTVQQHIPYEKWTDHWRQTQVERAAQLKSLSDANKSWPAPSAQKSPAPSSDGGDRHASGEAAIAMQAAIALPQGTMLLLSPSAGRFGSHLSIRATDWQIVDPDLAAVRAETPERVLHLLIEAVEQRNYFALLRLLSTSERKALEAELRERVDRLRTSLSRAKTTTAPWPTTTSTSTSTATPVNPAPLTPAIEVHGDRAHFQYDPRFFIDLVRERDGWRVLDLN